MDLLQLEHFLAVVDEGTFARAAERVSRTQPAVSQGIKTLVDYARKMVRTRDDAMRHLGPRRAPKAGALNVAAHESAAVYLLPGPLRTYLTRFPDVKVGIYRSPLADIPGQVMDREIDVGFVKDEPVFHELTCAEVHSDETILVAAPGHPLVGHQGIRVSDLGSERFVVHHLCSTTEQNVLRLFAQHRTPCRIAAELWSFENIKSFVRAEVGLAIVPRITVARELRDGTLVQIPVAELKMPRRTLMIFREQRSLSPSTRALIKIVRNFNWEAEMLPLRATASSRRRA